MGIIVLLLGGAGHQGSSYGSMTCRSRLVWGLAVPNVVIKTAFVTALL